MYLVFPRLNPDYIRTFTWDKKLEMVVKSSGILGGQGKSGTETQGWLGGGGCFGIIENLLLGNLFPL